MFNFAKTIFFPLFLGGAPVFFMEKELSGINAPSMLFYAILVIATEEPATKFHVIPTPTLFVVPPTPQYR